MFAVAAMVLAFLGVGLMGVAGLLTASLAPTSGGHPVVEAVLYGASACWSLAALAVILGIVFHR